MDAVRTVTIERQPVKIISLRNLLEKHYSALAADFREYFHTSVDQIGAEVSWREAVGLVDELANTLGSRFQQIQHQWDFRATHETILLIGLVNVTKQANSQRRLRRDELLAYPWKFTASVLGKGKSLPLKKAHRLFKLANPDLPDL